VQISVIPPLGLATRDRKCNLENLLGSHSETCADATAVIITSRGFDFIYEHSFFDECGANGAYTVSLRTPSSSFPPAIKDRVAQARPPF